ncbi:MAG: hypothetical protein CVU65_12495 [Deltaproteobacteria bacterium HGW-Deltaproteobacteria-22]|nr:MAG: hypothetical protein CVU65_12495 [Deltaproteobacteria bacterium HGW-Deltaproteobacteria-22]
MINKLFIVLSLLAISTLAIACDDDGGGGINAEQWCADTCQKTVDCALGPTLSECTTECEEMAANMLADYLDAYSTCLLDAECTELTADPEMCATGSEALCTTDTADYNRAACLKILECDGNTDPSEAEIAQCITRQHGDGDMIKCFKPAFVQHTIDCIEAATSCSPAPVATCVYDILGLTLGTGNTNNQQ